MARMDRIGTTATRIERHGANTYVWYHSTPVVSFDDKTVLLRNDGYYTATTKTRMNQASHQFGLGFTVYQKDFDWYVTTPTGETFPFGATSNGFSFQR